MDELDFDSEEEDEVVTEDGIIIEQSDIDSDDLYNMRRMIFSSETETADFNDDDKSLEEEIRRAMDHVDQRKKIYDTEDRSILDTYSSTEKYMSRPHKRNHKYV